MTHKKREMYSGLIFIFPWIIGVLTFIAYPLFRTIYFSFNNVQYSGELGFIYNWVGFENYHRILRIDVDFILEIQNFIIKTITFVPVEIGRASCRERV